MKFLESFLCFLLKLGMTSAQFIEQPDPGTVLSSVQNVVTLTCSLEERYVVDWRVAFSIGGEAAFASNRISHMLLVQQGFTLEEIGTRRSILSLRETGARNNSGVNITCAAQETGAISSTTFGNTVQVIFCGAPPAPTSLNVEENEIGSLYISSSLSFIEGIPVNCTLTAQNTTRAQSTRLKGQHYVFEIDRMCDVYSFTVSAMTASGNSTPSQDFIFRSSICPVTTIRALENSSLMTSPTTVFTTSSVPIQDKLTTVFVQESSATTLTIVVSIVVATVITTLVLVNVLVCAYCHKQNKPTSISNYKDPVYEAPNDVMPSPSPFVMTPSLAYEVAKLPQKHLSSMSSANESSKCCTADSSSPKGE